MISSFEDNIKTALKEAVILRQSDMFSNADGTRGLVVDIKEKFPKGNAVLIRTPYTHDPKDPDRIVFSLDEARTISESPKGAYESLQHLQNWVSRYGKDEHSTETAEDHYKVLKAWRMTRAELSMYC